eukprot:Amastigsp_a6754_25.p3 type:complete len:139 gc:universal Amastigsp_a6754_25:436-20(-)
MVKLDIIDTAGTTPAGFSALREAYMSEGQAFILLYAINMQDSLAGLEADLEQLQRLRNMLDGVVVAIAGNKCDLEAERRISTADGEARAAALRASSHASVLFMEVSAKTPHNVNELFRQVVEAHCAALPPPKKHCVLQ